MMKFFLFFHKKNEHWNFLYVPFRRTFRGTVVREREERSKQRGVIKSWRINVSEKVLT